MNADGRRCARRGAVFAIQLPLDSTRGRRLMRCGRDKMIEIIDCFGRRVRLTDERLTHILEHVEMRGVTEESSACCASRNGCGDRAAMPKQNCSTGITHGR